MDRLLKWSELQSGGTKLERVLKACNERGIFAVPLTPKWLSENHADLCATEKAASRWLDDKPQFQNMDYSYWGDFYRFRLAGKGGHQRWAIIKNGTDDPGGALSAVIGQEIKDLELSG